MKLIIVILSCLVLQSSASIFDDFEDTMSSIGDSLERVITGVLTDVKETIDCSIFAVQQVLKLDGVFSDPSEYKKKCNGEEETISASDESRNEIAVNFPEPQVTYEFKAQDMTISSNGVTKEVSVAINKTKSTVNKTLCNIYDKGNTRIKLQNAKNVLKTGSDHLTEVSAIISKELDNISTDHKNKYDTGEPKSEEPSANRVRYEINVLNEIEESNKTSLKIKNDSDTSEKVLLKLQTDTNKSNHDDVKVINIMKAADTESNSTRTKLELHWNERNPKGKSQFDTNEAIKNKTAKANTISVNFPESFKNVAKKILEQSNVVQHINHSNGIGEEKNVDGDFFKNSTNYLNIIKESNGTQNIVKSNDTIVTKKNINDTERYVKVNMKKIVDDADIINARKIELNVNSTLKNSSAVTTKISQFKLETVKGKYIDDGDDVLQDGKDFKTKNMTKIIEDSNVINASQIELNVNSTRKNSSIVTRSISKIKLGTVAGKSSDKTVDVLRDGNDLKTNTTKISKDPKIINASQIGLNLNSTLINPNSLTTKISKFKLETVKGKYIDDGDDLLQDGKDFKTKNMTKIIEDANVINASQIELNVNSTRKNSSTVTKNISEFKLGTVVGKSSDKTVDVLRDGKDLKMNTTKIVKDPKIINASQIELNLNSTLINPNSLTTKISKLKIGTVNGKSIADGDGVLHDGKGFKTNMTKIGKDFNVKHTSQKELNVNSTRSNQSSVTKKISQFKLETVESKSFDDGDDVVKNGKDFKTNVTEIVEDSNVSNDSRIKLNVNSIKNNLSSGTTEISEIQLETVEGKTFVDGNEVLQDEKNNNFTSMDDEEFEDFLDSFYSSETGESVHPVDNPDKTDLELK